MALCPDVTVFRRALLLMVLGSPAAAQPLPPVWSELKFVPEDVGPVGTSDSWGHALAPLGDVDGDGLRELSLGVPGYDGVGLDRGAVWITHATGGGGLSPTTLISSGSGGFSGHLDNGDAFGSAVTSLGDLDGDGVEDLAVGARGDDDGGEFRGAVWILFMAPDGTVDRHQKISALAGGFTGALDDWGGFGSALANLGDLDGDGVTDLAVGAPFHGGLAVQSGAVWILFLRPTGQVKAQLLVAEGQGLAAPLWIEAHFGRSLAPLGDLDGDGTVELAVGAPDDAAGVGGPGNSVFVLSLGASGVQGEPVWITEDSGGFSGAIEGIDDFGTALACVGDLNGNGVVDLAVGAPGDAGGGGLLDRHGAVWLLSMATDGQVLDQRELSEVAGGFTGPLATADAFGTGLAALGPQPDGSCRGLFVGATGDDSLAGQELFQTGAIYSLVLDLDDPWSDLGQALPGSAGPPLLADVGCLCPGHPLVLKLFWAKPFEPAWLVVGFAPLFAPLLGGVLVPDPAPPGFLLTYDTGPLGQVDVLGTWPEVVPPGLEVFVQFWVRDGGAPKGLSASNGVTTTTP